MEWIIHTTASPGEFLATYREYFGPAMIAFAAADANGREAELQQGHEQMFDAENRDRMGTGFWAKFLKVAVTKGLGAKTYSGPNVYCLLVM